MQQLRRASKAALRGVGVAVGVAEYFLAQSAPGLLRAIHRALDSAMGSSGGDGGGGGGARRGRRAIFGGEDPEEVERAVKNMQRAAKTVKEGGSQAQRFAMRNLSRAMRAVAEVRITPEEVRELVKTGAFWRKAFLWTTYASAGSSLLTVGLYMSTAEAQTEWEQLYREAVRLSSERRQLLQEVAEFRHQVAAEGHGTQDEYVPISLENTIFLRPQPDRPPRWDPGVADAPPVWLMTNY